MCFHHFNKIYLLLFLLVGLVNQDLTAQQKDTLRVMTYNLLYYREVTTFCTSSNNATADKEAAMEKIIDETLPDILVVNEMGGSSSVNAFRLLQNALNKNGRTNYNLANSTGIGGTNSQNIVNMLYFNTDKLVLESQTTIEKDLNNNTLVRLIDDYQLRYKDSNLAVHQDTIRLHVLAAHLKAGSSTSDENERAEATEAVMAQLDSINASGNYIFAGDLNLYSSTEPAYQDLLNYVDTSIRFYDPVGVAGSWHNDSRYASLHTQSTRTSGGCAAGGGMDDRFDFILTSDEILNNTNRLNYLLNSYETFGQDGLRFNGSIISPNNTAVDSATAEALYDMSDHLPVLLEMEVDLPQTTTIPSFSLMDYYFENPTTGVFNLNLNQFNQPISKVEVFDISGRIVYEATVNAVNEITINLSNSPNGPYFIRVISKSFQQKTKKLIKI
ncbi:MAG: T9SS type A sorting domain-containing protein [Vicingaceae bacterium]